MPLWRNRRRSIRGDFLDENEFPDPNTADDNGIVVVGGHPTPEALRTAYPMGIFPWPHSNLPLLWFSPDPRFVLEPKKAHIHRSLRKTMRKGGYSVTFDTAFDDVIAGCSHAYRPGQGGTWITGEMRRGYGALHRQGYAHSVEAWLNGELVGGLYGVSFGRVFFGESMFAKAPDASKVAFATLLAHLLVWDFPLVDCQSRTDHLERFGAVHWPRQNFLDALKIYTVEPSKVAPWPTSMTPAQAADYLQEHLQEQHSEQSNQNSNQNSAKNNPQDDP